MVTKLRTVVFGVLFVLPWIAGAQQKQDSVTQLHEVVIEQSRLGGYAINKYTLKVDSLTRQLANAGSLADLMRKYGFGHLRAYGPGGLATASFRGTGSSHTSVLWNGIQLLSPLSGQLDLSLVPVSFIDDASVQTGGVTSLYGNGSIGGTIHLNNSAVFNEGLKLNAFVSAGSFASYYQGIGASWSKKKFISSTKVFLNDAKNNFEYLNKNIFPAKLEQRDHMAIHQKGILQQNYWQPSLRQLVTFKFWYQDNTYQVPNPSSVSRKAEALERNTFYRAVAGWHYNNQLMDISYQGAFIRHDLNYSDPSANIASKSKFNTMINNLETNFSLAKNGNATTGLNYTWEQGIVDEFGKDAPQRSRVAMFSAFKWKLFEKWNLASAFREEWVNGKATPFAPSLTTKWKGVNGLETYASVSRNYRIPTFNDLYWKGAGAHGNASLKPELSISNELGFNYTSPATQSHSSWSLKTALYSNNVNDWILWSPLTASIWSPQNIKRVWSRGFETQASGRTKVSDVGLEFAIQYSFTKSTNEEIYKAGNSSELNKQLMFTPMHEGSVTARVLWKGYSLNNILTYTGKQYTDGDNSEFNAMQTYSLFNVSLNKSVLFIQSKASVFCEINNVFSSVYQSRPGYPMPGRNYRLGITFYFNKPNSI